MPTQLALTVHEVASALEATNRDAANKLHNLADEIVEYGQRLHAKIHKINNDLTALTLNIAVLREDNEQLHALQQTVEQLLIEFQRLTTEEA